MLRATALVLSVILLAAGVLLAIVYPRLMRGSPGHEIGNWTVYSGGGEFASVEAPLDPAEGGTIITVTAYGAPLRAGEAREVLVLAVLDDGGEQVYRAALGFHGTGVLDNPQTGVMRFRQSPGTLEPLAGPHRFVFEAGRNFDDGIRTVELALNAATRPVNPDARPVGMALMLVSGIGLAFSLRRRRENPNSGPPPQKWGRR